MSEFGKDVVTLLEPKPDERILDLGCGTGILTEEIAKTGAQTVGIDSSEAMITKARQTYSHLTFQIADGHDFHFEKKIDAVFSNAALHWMTQPEQVIACVWQNLKSGGRFVAEFGGQRQYSNHCG